MLSARTREPETAAPPAERADARPATARLGRALALSLVVLAIAALVGLAVGYQRLELGALLEDDRARALFLRLRLPRVVMAGLVGSSLAVVGTALQALFRNPLAEPFTLGVSGGGAFGASVAIALGLGASVAGVPLVFLAAFAGAGAAVLVVYQVARTRTILLPGALLLGGVVVNITSGAGVLIIQYLTEYTRALQILRWMIGSLDVVGFDLIWRMLVVLVPGWVVLLALSRDLHLLAVGEETAASLGVDVRRVEKLVYAASALVVGVTVAVGGTIGFVGLIVPHAVRIWFGEDVRVVLPCSLLVGGAFLILADTVARTAFGEGELPVGAVTAVLGGPLFLWLLRRQQRYSVL